MKPVLVRITTVPLSLKVLLAGQFTFFQQHDFEVVTVSADGPEVPGLQAQGVRHCVVNMTRKITPFHDLVALWQLVQLIRKLKPDIVHTHTPKAGLLGMMAAWICGVKVRMHTVAGLPLMEATGIKRWILVVVERLTYACANSVYPNSTGLMEFIKAEISTENPKLKIIGRGSSNGIDTTFFQKTPALENQAKSIRSQYAIPDNTTVFSFVGRIVKDKGVVELVEAFLRISKTAPAKLLLVGSFEENLDPLPADIMTIIKSNPDIIVAGFQQDVRPWILSSDVFVFPSYREGFPNVVMQASCLEVPCIVTDINGCNEIIEQESTGLIIPVKSSESLFKAMVRLMEDQPLRRSFGKQARTFVVANFDHAYVCGELLKEYRMLLNSRR